MIRVLASVGADGPVRPGKEYPIDSVTEFIGKGGRRWVDIPAREAVVLEKALAEAGVPFQRRELVVRYSRAPYRVDTKRFIGRELR